MATPVYVGILTSTTFSGGSSSVGNDFKTAFETGFKATVTGGGAPTYSTNVVEAGGKYDSTGTIRKDLYKGVNHLMSGTNPATMIVSFGGLVAAHAVVKKATVPFLVLVGRIPESDDFGLDDGDGTYCGGVDLHTVHNNMERRDALLAQYTSIAASDVWLLYNPNSRMSKSEAHEWRAQGGNALAATVAGDNDENDFDPAFKRLKRKGAAGVIISADPFFAQQRNDLVTAANKAATTAGGGMKICYPTEVFGITSATTKPSAGSGIHIGPILLDAYTAMGKKAGNIANALAQPGQALPFQGLDTSSLLSSPVVYT